MTSNFDTPPGWYPDPHGSGQRQYWDGQRWAAPTPVAPPGGQSWPGPAGGYPPAPQQNRGRTLAIVIVAVVVALGLTIGLIAAYSGSSESAEDSSSHSASSDWSPKERAFLDDLEGEHFDNVLSEEGHIALAMEACSVAEANYTQGAGITTRDSLVMIGQDTGLPGNEVIAYWDIVAHHYCPRWSPSGLRN